MLFTLVSSQCLSFSSCNKQNPRQLGWDSMAIFKGAWQILLTHSQVPMDSATFLLRYVRIFLFKSSNLKIVTLELSHPTIWGDNSEETKWTKNGTILNALFYIINDNEIQNLTTLCTKPSLKPKASHIPFLMFLSGVLPAAFDQFLEQHKCISEVWNNASISVTSTCTTFY